MMPDTWSIPPVSKTYTGRSLITSRPDAQDSHFTEFSKYVDSRLGETIPAHETRERHHRYFSRYDVGIIDAPYEFLRDLATDAVKEQFRLEEVEPERRSYFLRVTADGNPTTPLRNMAAVTSSATGAGASVAILDTGFDFSHPDFSSRTFVIRSFTGASANDDDGHGTHCTGLICGPRSTDAGEGYGVAPGARILIGRVSDSDDMASDEDVIAGIEWAEEQRADVILLALGVDTAPMDFYSRAFEQVAYVVLRNNRLIVAAAGQHEDPRTPASVFRPANCPSIMAVAWLDANMNPSPFSNSLIPPGDVIDVSAPGQNIRSCWPVGQKTGGYLAISGTSMAAAHVAGIAALWVEKGFRGKSLWSRLASAARMSGASALVGAGLIMAP